MLRGAGNVAQMAFRAFLALLDHSGFETSGYAAFTALLSLFPFLLFLTALAGFFVDEKIAEQVFAGALEFAPQEVVGVIRPVIYELLTQRYGELLTIGIVFALRSAFSGIEALPTILALLFFYLIAIIFACGAEVNAQLQHLDRPADAPDGSTVRLLHRH